MADYILSKTGEEVEAILNSVGDKANASEVYTKIEVDASITNINTSITNLGTAVSDINTAIGNINTILESI